MLIGKQKNLSNNLFFLNSLLDRANTKMLSTSFSCSLLARKTTRSSFSKIKFDLGIITQIFSDDCSYSDIFCKFESLILLSNSDFSKIFASINSYSPSSNE